jgi:predicted ATP-dependent serine protease
MAYQCLDCSNQSSKKFPAGRCPACNSYNIKSDRQGMVYEKDKPKKTLAEILIMSVLWGALLLGVIDRYIL